MTNKISKDFFTFDEVLCAYMQCRKHKRGTTQAMEYENNFVPKLMKLTNIINSHKFKIGRYKCFPVTKPKLREVWAAPFKDRIVHHLIHNALCKEFEKHFIDQTYSCIKGRGTMKCIKAAFKGCRSITNNFQSEAFFIKLDIQSFFVSIDKMILWDILKERVNENCLLAELIKTVLFQDITVNPIKVNPALLEQVPEYKTLFKTDYTKKGLPIGNLTSQFFSNIYLDGLDQFCKHHLKLKYYYRYADDILILIKDSSEAKHIVSKISEWLLNNRGLTINPKKTFVNRIRHGIKFVGSRLFYHYKIPSKATFDKIQYICKRFKKDVFNKKIHASLNSYLGLGRGFNTYLFRARVLDKTRLNLIYDNDAKKVVYL